MRHDIERGVASYLRWLSAPIGDDFEEKKAGLVRRLSKGPGRDLSEFGCGQAHGYVMGSVAGERAAQRKRRKGKRRG